MGACTGKSKRPVKMQLVKVGGGELGIVKWLVLEG